MKTKTSLFLNILFLFSIVLAACASTSNASPADAQSNPQPDDASLPLATRLAIGTLKLEDTDQAVTAEQAASLLTLWQAYQALSNSDTAAAAELDAVIKQIQAAMTPEQIAAIEAMQLTRQSVAEVMQSLGIDLGARPAGASGTPAAGQSSSGDFPRRGGDFPGGVPPDGGGFPMEGGGPGFGAQVGGTQTTPNASTRATMQARFSSQASRVSPMLLNTLIQMLESKSQP